jgi:hypothetical protein
MSVVEDCHRCRGARRSISTGMQPFTASTTSASTPIVACPLSSTRPPGFETLGPYTPCCSACLASSPHGAICAYLRVASTRPKAYRCAVSVRRKGRSIRFGLLKLAFMRPVRTLAARDFTGSGIPSAADQLLKNAKVRVGSKGAGLLYIGLVSRRANTGRWAQRVTSPSRVFAEVGRSPASATDPTECMPILIGLQFEPRIGMQEELR